MADADAMVEKHLRLSVGRTSPLPTRSVSPYLSATVDGNCADQAVHQASLSMSASMDEVLSKNAQFKLATPVAMQTGSTLSLSTGTGTGSATTSYDVQREEVRGKGVEREVHGEELASTKEIDARAQQRAEQTREAKRLESELEKK